MPYRLTQNADVLKTWDNRPSMVTVPGVGDVHCIEPGWASGDFLFERVVVETVEREPPPPAPLTSHDVNSERDRRLATFSFAGKAYDFGGESTVNIVGAGTLALAAIINGAQPGNLRWANPDLDFRWICADNSTVTMDAQTCFAFAQAAAQWKSSHILTGRTIKDMTPIPSDFASDARWPS